MSATLYRQMGQMQFSSCWSGTLIEAISFFVPSFRINYRLTTERYREYIEFPRIDNL